MQMAKATRLAIAAAMTITALVCGRLEAQPKPKTQNVLFVMTDGLRWQEVFGGPEDALIPAKHDDDPYWKGTPEERRKALMPFLWEVVAKQGQIYGNLKQGSDFHVTNGFTFSYPGYSEMLCGFADPRVDSNDANPNPNVTVLEWLNGRPAFHGKVAAFGAWNVIAPAINSERCGFVVNAGYDPFTAIPTTPSIRLLNDLKKEIPHKWWGEPFDAITHHTAMEYLAAKKPRVLYISYGETDEWGHEGEYIEYLASAHRVDAFIRILWQTLQSMPQYRGKTTLIVGTDHGRGDGPNWTHHSHNRAGAKQTWLAVMGPDTPALGERSNVPTQTEDQVAATLAALLGEDYAAAQPKAGKPIADALPK